MKTRNTSAARRPAAALTLCCLIFLAWSVEVQGKEEAGLKQALALMNAASTHFRSFRARFSQKKYTAILKEFNTPDTGEFYYGRAKDGSVLLRQDVTSPGRSILTVKGDEAKFYQPDIKLAQIASLGNYKNLAEFLALGIGQSPAKLQDTFDMSYQGSEPINGSPCSILVLKPKAASVAARFSFITLWIKKSNGLPVQNKLQEPSGDYVLVTFSDEKLNVKIPGSKFEQKLPGGIDIQRIQ